MEQENDMRIRIVNHKKGSRLYCVFKECRGGPFSGITASSGPLIAVIQLEQDKGSEFPFYLLKALLRPHERNLGKGRFLMIHGISLTAMTGTKSGGGQKVRRHYNHSSDQPPL